jgi:hypothetical protein
MVGRPIEVHINICFSIRWPFGGVGKGDPLQYSPTLTVRGKTGKESQQERYKAKRKTGETEERKKNAH